MYLAKELVLQHINQDTSELIESCKGYATISAHDEAKPGLAENWVFWFEDKSKLTIQLYRDEVTITMAETSTQPFYISPATEGY